MTGLLIAPIIPGAAGPREPRPTVRRSVVRARRQLPFGTAADRANRYRGVRGSRTRLSRPDRRSSRVARLGLDSRRPTRHSATRDLVTVRARTDGAAGGSGVMPQGHVRLPAQVRHRCGLRPGDRVLLAADPSAGVLRVFPPATVDALLPALTANPDDDQNVP